MHTLRTPDERFAVLPEFPYPPSYCDVSDDDGGTLRMAWVEDGPADADPMLMLNGEPSWSFLYRKMIPTLVAAGRFLQEDAGEELAGYIADFLGR